jgi:RNA polymerase sigma factor (sigma-70 family)
MTEHNHLTELAERIRLGDNKAFDYLYQNYYRQAAAFVKANTGNEQDARDVFQEALLIFYKQACKEGFKLTADPGTFLYAIVRNLWRYRLRTRRTHPEAVATEPARLPEMGADDAENHAVEQMLNEKHQTIQQLIDTLKTECRQLIAYTYYHKLPSAEIARLLGYTEAFVKVKKHRCMEVLREKVKKHPVFSDGR